MIVAKIMGDEGENQKPAPWCSHLFASPCVNDFQQSGWWIRSALAFDYENNPRNDPDDDTDTVLWVRAVWAVTCSAVKGCYCYTMPFIKREEKDIECRGVIMHVVFVLALLAC